MSKIVLISNIPAPYREMVHEKVSLFFERNYQVFYCSKLEPNRQWKFSYGDYDRIFLAENSDGYIHNNLNVWKKLNKISPTIVITTGFNPTMLYAFIWCLFYRKIHITFTDGTLSSEKNLSFLHSLVRRVVYFSTKAFIGPSRGNFKLYRNYKIPESKIFNSCLCINNGLFFPSNPSNKEFDIMFSGQFIDRKMPLFFIEVAKLLKEKMGHCNILILGDGQLKDALLEKLKEYKISYEYPGFVEQCSLPAYYSRAKLFLFPTENDPWGVVVNESMASGVPVITCEPAGVANDLVLHEQNGYVLPLDVEIWADHAIKLLNDMPLYEKFSQNGIHHVQKYNSNSAAEGIIKAIEFSLNEK